MKSCISLEFFQGRRACAIRERPAAAAVAQHPSLHRSWPRACCWCRSGSPAACWSGTISSMRCINPGRYAVTQGRRSRRPHCWRARRGARRGFAADGGAAARERAGPRPSRRASSAAANGGGRPRLITVYLDPPTGRVLDGGRVARLAHRLPAPFPREPDDAGIERPRHRRLGRRCDADAVAVSGIYLWWPRNAGFRRGLRWRRGPRPRSTCITLSGSGFPSRSPWCRRPASISAFRSRAASCCRRLRR